MGALCSKVRNDAHSPAQLPCSSSAGAAGKGGLMVPWLPSCDMLFVYWGR